eukprot:Phypoly_transcript_12469.p1 GENE.Phypoly_transcript_12469~~Phypoly_transcript_12469.p1  ORF type:complete len:326 (+),score=33.49 Phypoly_transcript_12469:114-1091(+)
MNKVKQDFTNLVDSVEKRIKELESMERHWSALEASMEQHASMAADQITLNVGGQKFTTSKTTLLSHKGSFFDAMLSSGKWKPDSKGRYFIDRNPELFPVILDYLRTGKVNLKKYSYDVYEDLQTELDFYLISIPETMLTPYKVLDTALEKKLKEWTKKSTLTLLYSGSRDGFEAQVFHAKCNNKGPTVTCVKSTQGYVFGGYAAAAWDSSNQFKSAPGSFLFTFHNPYQFAPTTFLRKGRFNHGVTNISDIFTFSTYGPTFGGQGCWGTNTNATAHDILISDNCNIYNCTSNFPHSYQDTSGYGAAIFTGSANFLVSEIEVFLVN